MPFTLAHPAAVLPLRRPLARTLGFLPLVVGSMVPDFHYLIPIGLLREQTHSIAGWFVFCLPVGVLTTLFVRTLGWRPLIALLPSGFRARLAPARPRPSRPWFREGPAILLAVWIGSGTHLVWDDITHGTSPIVRLLPVLRMRIVTIAHSELALFRILQHVSSVGGLVIVAFAVHRWWLRTEPRRIDAATTAARVAARRARLVLPAAALIGAAMGALAFRHHDPTLLVIYSAFYAALIGALNVAGPGLVLYCAVWHWIEVRSARAISGVETR